jgi:hypothetical protein
MSRGRGEGDVGEENEMRRDEERSRSGGEGEEGRKEKGERGGREEEKRQKVATMPLFVR